MAKDVIKVDGKDVVVREDTAKAFRGVHWAILSIGIFLAIMAVLFFTLFWKTAHDGNIETPAQAGNANTR